MLFEMVVILIIGVCFFWVFWGGNGGIGEGSWVLDGWVDGLIEGVFGCWWVWL